MKSSISLGRIAGVQVGLHYSWFIIALLIVVSLAGLLARAWPQQEPWALWGLATVTAVGFFACLLLHELAHAAMARRRGVPVDAITLFALGGVSHAGKESPDATTEFLIGIVGPLASAALGLVCLSVAGMLAPSPARAAVGWLGSINLALAFFNLAPGFPLDGGRVLRAAVWGFTGSLDKATKTAGAAGQAFALLLIVLGAAQFIAAPAAGGGIWLALVGMFLLQASGASILQVDLRRMLDGVPVGEIMRRDLPVVDEDEDLETFAAHAARPYIVNHDGLPAGIITPGEVRQARRKHRPAAVRDAMLALDSVPALHVEDSSWQALERLSREKLSALPVLEGGNLAGVVSPDEIIAAVRARRRLGRV